MQNLNQIAELSGFNVIGLRAMTGGQIVKAGDLLGCSFVWSDGSQTDEKLDGISAIDCGFDGFDELKKINRAMALVKQYSGQMVLVGTNSQCYEGNDVGEVVMPDAVVIAVVDQS